jgi:hypothetical protein
VFDTPVLASGLANETGVIVVELVIEAAAGVPDSLGADAEPLGARGSASKLLEIVMGRSIVG